MSDRTDAFFSELSPTLTMVDEVLDAWTVKGKYKLPALFQVIQEKMQWDKEQMHWKDPIIRAYLRNHSVYGVDRGAGGGVFRRVDKQAKIAKSAEISKAKADINAMLDAELAKKAAMLVVIDEEVEEETLTLDEENAAE